MHFGKQKVKVVSQQTKPNSYSYSAQSIERARLGCYDKNKKLMIDAGYGDYNMSLFRLKEKRRYMRDIPSLFTSSMISSMQQKRQRQNQECDRIASQHNQIIQRILDEPTQTYFRKMKLERQLLLQEDRIRNQYVKGQDRQVREYQGQLSFNYLPSHQADKWFKIRDNVQTSLPPLKVIAPQQKAPAKAKSRKRKGYIFMSDYMTRNRQNKLLI